MSPLVHGLIAWLLAILLMKNLNDRRLICIVGVIPDIDGIYILYNMDLYYKYHHTWGHSYLFGLAVIMFLLIFAKERKKYMSVAFGAFSLHLIADYFGSDWKVYLLYPLSKYGLTSSDYLSNFVIYNVINPIVIGILLISVFYIFFNKEKSPLEFISEKLNRIFLNLIVYPLSFKCEICSEPAYMQCIKCGKKIYSKHSKGYFKKECSECSIKKGI